jgi:hypothetical protein
MTPPPASRPPEPAALAGLLERLAQLLLLIALAALLPGLFPFQPLAAAWSLRIGQIVVEMAPVILLALICCLLAQHIQPPIGRRLGARIAGIGYGLYLALVPLLLLAYGSLWVASDRETQQRLETLSTQAQQVQPRLEAATTTAELQAIVPLPSQRPADLVGQKQLVLQALNNQLEQQRRQLLQQRDQFQLSSLMATLRGALVAGVMAGGLRWVTRRASY